MSHTVSYPLPQLNAPFVRYYGQPLRKQQAALTSIDGDEDGDWVGIVTTRHGVEHIYGARNTRTMSDWHPADWVWDDECLTFRPPNSVWHEKLSCFVPTSNLVNGKVVLPKLEELPAPTSRESFATWKARVKAAHPVLLDHPEAAALLLDAWKGQRKTQQGVSGSALLPPNS